MIRALAHRLAHLVSGWPAHIPTGTWVEVKSCRASSPNHIGRIGRVMWCESGPVVGLERCQAGGCRVLTVEEVALRELAR